MRGVELLRHLRLQRLRGGPAPAASSVFASSAVLQLNPTMACLSTSASVPPKIPEDEILTEDKFSTKVAILNRPGKLNALNFPMGNGRAFCAGGDVADVHRLAIGDSKHKYHNTSTTKQTSPFQENTKRPSSPPAAKQKASEASPELPLDIQLQKVETLDDFEYRVLGTSKNMEDTGDEDFLRELDEIGRSARGILDFDEGEEESGVDENEGWDDDKAQVLTDLALSNLEEFDLEDEERPYRLRADRLFFPGQTYDPEDLDISKPVTELEKPTMRTRKNYSSKEVCQIADFRNPRYLSNFIRDSSRILPRRQHRVSAKAQRRIAREIKTARILGLMPFTSMGDPPFRFRRSRSDEDVYPGSEDD